MTNEVLQFWQTRTESVEVLRVSSMWLVTFYLLLVIQLQLDNIVRNKSFRADLTNKEFQIR